MERIRNTAIKGMGALLDPQAGTTHNVIQKGIRN